MRPRHDPPSGPKKMGAAALARAIAARLEAARRRRRPGEEGQPCPVGPDRPLDLSGGAAAALEFDD